MGKRNKCRDAHQEQQIITYLLQTAVNINSNKFTINLNELGTSLRQSLSQVKRVIDKLRKEKILNICDKLTVGNETLYTCELSIVHGER